MSVPVFYSDHTTVHRTWWTNHQCPLLPLWTWSFLQNWRCPASPHPSVLLALRAPVHFSELEALVVLWDPLWVYPKEPIPPWSPRLAYLFGDKHRSDPVGKAWAWAIWWYSCRAPLARSVSRPIYRHWACLSTQSQVPPKLELVFDSVRTMERRTWRTNRPSLMSQNGSDPRNWNRLAWRLPLQRICRRLLLLLQLLQLSLLLQPRSLHHLSQHRWLTPREWAIMILTTTSTWWDAWMLQLTR